MPQVSCRMFEMYERGAAELGIPPEQLLAGTSLTLDFVRNKRNRAPWDEWVGVSQNFEDVIGGPEVMKTWGTRILDHDYTSLIRRMASFFLTPAALYRAAIGWMGPVLYPHLDFTFEADGADLRVVIEIPEPHREGGAWLRLAQGTLVVLPRLLGKPDAEVSGEVTGRRADFRVRVQPGRSRNTRGRLLLQAAFRPQQLLDTLDEVRQDADEAYREALASEQEVRELLQALPDPVLVVSGTRIVETNRAWREGFGEGRGRDLLEICTPAERVRSLVAGEPGDGARELLLEREDGSAAICEVSSSSAFHYQGAPVRVLTLRDVSARREEEALIQLAERVSSLGTVAAGVAHDINNPLAVVIGNLETLALRLGELPSDHALRDLVEDVEPAMEGALRVAEIARSLVALPRGDTAEQTSAEVEKTLEAMVKVARNEIRHRATLERDYQPVPPVAVSPVQLGQVLLNLLVNAAQAIPAGRVQENQIKLTIAPASKEAVVITVRDTGPGIETEALEGIFDAFRTTKGASGGLGLGLAICRRTVEQAGGTIEVESAPGSGAIFKVTLPVARETGEGEPLAAEAERPVRSLDIVVVEDDPLLRSILVRQLAAHEVRHAACGEEALALLEQGPAPDVILCDVMMPDLTGTEVHAEVRKRRPELADRFLFMTGGAFGEKIADALDALPNRTISKPFRQEELLSLIGEVAQGRPCTGKAEKLD